MRINLFILPLFLLACNSSTPAPKPNPLAESTGGHTRLVWLQDAWDHNDVFSDAGQLRLMSLDSEDEHGEQIRIPGPAPLVKPLISPNGNWIVYSLKNPDRTFALPWDGNTPQLLAPGIALDLWQDPQTGHTWVYLGRDPVDPNRNAFNQLHRIRLDDPSIEEPVLAHSPFGRDSFQLSTDGLIAGGLFPWPNVGITDLRTGTWTPHGRGCWTALAPLPSPSLLWHLNGAHRALVLYDPATDEKWNVDLASHPAIEGHEIYHPRWSSHPRFLVMSGPYKIRKGGNNIRGGGNSVQLHIGRFAPDYRSIEAWTQVTDNPHANFFPDLWVNLPHEGYTPTTGSAQEMDPQGAITVTVKLMEITPTPSLADIAPYQSALAAHAYRVISPADFPHPDILIAQWVIRDRKRVDSTMKPGDQFELQILPYDDLPNLVGERMVIETSDLLLPLYMQNP